MQLPALLPPTFLHYATAATDEGLFNLMLQQPADFVVFFDHAADDETWSDTHQTYIKLALNWFTLQHFQEMLSWDVSKLLAKIIQTHHTHLIPYLPENLLLQLRDDKIEINSLLFACSSPIFSDLVHIECFEKQNNFISLNVTKEQFEVMAEFINTGTVAALWKYSQQDIIRLLKKTSSYGLSELKDLCEETLKRYIDRGNAIEMLLRSYKNSWNILEKKCCQVINGLSVGIHVDPLEKKRKYYEAAGIKPFGVEFLNFGDQALGFFHDLKSLVTHLICGGGLTDQREFSEVVQAPLHLISIDVSRSRNFSEKLFDASLSLKELDVSQCAWLTDENLMLLIMNYPHLKKLAVGSNTQLSFLSWSELNKLKNLTALDISRCNQIADDDISLIVKSLPNLTELNFEDCRKLSERAFFEIAHALGSVTSLNMARCNVTDAALLELTAKHPQIRMLDISRCRNFSEKGLIQSLKQLRNLKELSIKNCDLSDVGLDKIKQLLPNCEISE